ncbi:HPP family protein [Caulobacter sp. RL271]|uniref:HPP family protein n=1 Tax=Caulobacter segnis TaxID=88688 RepID=A0ABY4ZQ69_9CAUL|nr:HPP family protein [Caulobacter segnis]USQ94927.1 HPP family protein [Caulobacter segnis]
MTSRLHALVRGKSPIRPIDALRGGAGALLGLLFAGVLGRFAVSSVSGGGGDWLHPLLVAPIGASAVLVFAVPASPLAQPRSVLGGNIVSALVGITVALLVPQTLVAAPLAVGAAIGTMMLLGCLHPPGGAVALICVIGGPKVAQAGYLFALNPVAVDSLLLTGAGMIWGRLTGHSYPHRAPAAPANPHGAKDPSPASRIGYSATDLDVALARYGELLDVSREDLDALFREVELSAAQRLHGQIRCGDVMSRDVISLHHDQSAESALAYMREHDLRTAPVVDADNRVIGLARRAELQANRRRKVEAALDPFVHKVMEGTPIAALLPILSTGHTHEAMVVDGERRLIGVITQTDLIAVLYRAHIVEAVVGG